MTEVPLNTTEERTRFLRTCAEFLTYIVGDCPGLSPGVAFFRQSEEGLKHLVEVLPEQHAETLRDARGLYQTLVLEAPGPMYPRGSDLFDDLDRVQTILEGLGEVAYELEA